MRTALALLVMSASVFAQEKLDWKKDHDVALKEARKDGKYVIVHFSGPD